MPISLIAVNLGTNLIGKDKINLDEGLDQCIEWVKLNFDALKNGPLNYIHKR